MYIKHIEWESLQDSITSKSIAQLVDLKPAPDKIEIKRGSDFKVQVAMSRESASNQESEFERNLRLGEILTGKDVQFTGPSNQTVTLHNVIQYGNQRKGRADGNWQVDMRVSCHKVSSTFDNDHEKKHVFQYLIGCPRNYMWSRGTTRNETGSTTIARDRMTKETSKSAKNYNFSTPTFGTSSTNDCALISTDHGEALFSMSPIEGEPARFSPCYLHFTEEKQSTNKDFRDSWIEAISFALGKRLLAVGHSFFDEKGYPIEEHAYTPYATNFKKEVFSPELPPTYPGENGFNVYCEKKLSHLINLYLNKRSQLNLNEVLWNFWAANAMPLGLNFICYSSALEALIEAWFKSQGEGQVTKYVPASDYKKAIILPANLEIEKHVPGNKDWEFIRKRIHIPNDLSLIEKKRRFFAALDLQVGDTEEEAMKARNTYAHGESDSDVDPAKLLAITRAFQALIHRCILKCIGYEGAYFDYSAYDFPLHPLHDALIGRTNTAEVP